MKKISLVLMAVLAASLTARAQENLDLEDSPKVDFVAPFQRNAVPPVVELKAMNHLGLGYSHLLGAPEEMKAPGFGLDLSVVSVYIRPWRNAHTLSIGLFDFTTDFHAMKDKFSFDNLGHVIPVPVEEEKLKSRLYDFAFDFPIGYMYDGDKWGFGIYAAPGIGNTTFQKRYKLDDIKHYDQFDSRFSFRLGVKAAFWVDNIGIYARYMPLKYSPKGNNFATYDYTTLCIGVSVRM